MITLTAKRPTDPSAGSPPPRVGGAVVKSPSDVDGRGRRQPPARVGGCPAGWSRAHGPPRPPGHSVGRSTTGAGGMVAAPVRQVRTAADPGGVGGSGAGGRRIIRLRPPQWRQLHGRLCRAGRFRGRAPLRAVAPAAPRTGVVVRRRRVRRAGRP